MGYHTYFYACDQNKQVDWAKEILAKYQQQLKDELETIPDDRFFEKSYQDDLEEASNENYEKFHENAVKYDWGKDIVDENEAWFQSRRSPEFSPETLKKEWIERLDKIVATGLLDLKFDGDLAMDYVAFLVGNLEFLRYLRYYDSKLGLNYEVRDGKIYSGDILKRYYRVKGRYCESMWFNSDNIIEMIEDYPDYDSYDRTTGEYTKNRVLDDEEKAEIAHLFRGYPDCYCWII